MGKSSLFRADFITPINLKWAFEKSKPILCPPLSSPFVLQIHISERLAAHFDGSRDRIWAKLQIWNLEEPLTHDPCG